jgi:hypothetical protein
MAHIWLYGSRPAALHTIGTCSAQLLPGPCMSGDVGGLMVHQSFCHNCQCTFKGGGALGPGQTQFQAWCACDVRDVLCPVSCQYCGVHICTALAKCITCKLHTTTQHLPPCGYQLCTQLHWPTTMHECLGSRLSVCRAVYLVVVQSTCLVVAGFESILKPVGCWT